MTNLPMLPNAEEWTNITVQATLLVKSGFLPPGIDTPEKAIAIALKGREIGIPMMQAFSHISIIGGKPCMSAELMLGQIRRHVPGAVINYVEITDKRCIIAAARQSSEKLTQFEWNMDKAQQAGLVNKGPWKQYPGVMLKWRCVSEMARTLFPDAIMGVSYTPEEMGAEVNADGEILNVTPVKALAVPSTVTSSVKGASAAPHKDESAFDPENKVQAAKLKATLVKHNVDERHWSDVTSTLAGAPFSRENVLQAIKEAGMETGAI